MSDNTKTPSCALHEEFDRECPHCVDLLAKRMHREESGDRYDIRTYDVYRKAGNFKKLVGTLSMRSDGTHGKLWLNMWDDEFQVNEKPKVKR